MKNLFYILLLLAGFPAGYLLAYLCRDETKAWRKRMFILAILSLITAIAVSFTSFEYKFPVILTCFFIAILSLTIIYKSY